MLDTYFIDIKTDLNDETGLSFVSFVSDPAIEVNWLAFEDDHSNKIIFSIENEDQRVVYAPAMIANKPIYRRNGDYEYNVVFKPETIKKIVEKYSASGLLNSVDFQHNEQPLKDIIMIESFIVDRQNGIAPNNEFEYIPDGSWMCKFKVNNDEIWEQIKSGVVKGFSVAGNFILQEQLFAKIEKDEKDPIDELIDELLK